MMELTEQQVWILEQLEGWPKTTPELEAGAKNAGLTVFESTCSVVQAAQNLRARELVGLESDIHIRWTTTPAGIDALNAHIVQDFYDRRADANGQYGWPAYDNKLEEHCHD